MIFLVQDREGKSHRQWEVSVQSECAKYERRGLSGLHASARPALSVKQDMVIVCDLRSWRRVDC